MHQCGNFIVLYPSFNIRLSLIVEGVFNMPGFDKNHAALVVGYDNE